MNTFREYLSALKSASKFGEFLDGKKVTLPAGKEVIIKIQNSRRTLLRPGLRFSKYSYITEAITNEGAMGTGYGEANIKILAFEKSAAEAIERVVFRTLKNMGGGTP